MFNAEFSGTSFVLLKHPPLVPIILPPSPHIQTLPHTRINSTIRQFDPLGLDKAQGPHDQFIAEAGDRARVSWGWVGGIGSLREVEAQVVEAGYQGPGGVCLFGAFAEDFVDVRVALVGRGCQGGGEGVGGKEVAEPGVD